MDRLAYVELPAFPLQILLADHPDWRDAPAVVVERDKPHAVILWVNESARGRAILPGLSYAQGLALDGSLRAGVIGQARLDESVEQVLDRLRAFTPRVEPNREDPGGFWLDAAGLERLESSASAWAVRIRGALESQGWAACVVVGFQRSNVYVAAKTFHQGTAFPDPDAERGAVDRVPLTRLPLPRRDREALARLGVSCVGELRALPASSVARRFQPETLLWHRRLHDRLDETLQASVPVEPCAVTVQLPYGETNTERLLFPVKRALDVLLHRLADRYRSLAAVSMTLAREDHAPLAFALRPAVPTLDGLIVLDLLRLRLEGLDWVAPVLEFTLAAEPGAATREQLDLFHRPRRDLAAADRALARLRAEFGESAVLKAVLGDGHCPEAAFSLEPLAALPAPQPRPTIHGRRIRRVLDHPVALPPRPGLEPDGWLVNGLESGPVVRADGPYTLSGGWWRREIRRRYYFVETERGDALWVYYDERRRRWFRQGEIE